MNSLIDDATALGLRQAFGSAGIALGSSFFALGVLFFASGYTLPESIASTVFNFALPGQLIAAELHAQGVGLAGIAVAVALVNARLFPMTISLAPLLRPANPKLRDLLLSVHLLAVTSWVCFITGHRELKAESRFRYFVTLGIALWMLSIFMTAAGYWAASALPKEIALGLLFLNPAYFLCMIIRGLDGKPHAAAIIFGLILCAPLHFVSADWGIIAAGIVGGSAAFFIFDGRNAG